MPTDGKTSESLLKLYTPVFTLISTLESNNDFGNPEELAVKTLQLLQDVRETSRIQGKNVDWVSDAQYAVVAFVDEKINRSDWHGKDLWRQYPLSARLGMQPNTGVLFFDKLHAWMKSPDNVSEILEVFYVCMGLGFHGRYFTQQDQLAQLRRDVLRKLTKDEDPPEKLTPGAYKASHGQITIDADNFPWTWYISVAVGILLVLFVIVKTLSIADINELIDSMVGAAKE